MSRTLAGLVGEAQVDRLVDAAALASLGGELSVLEVRRSSAAGLHRKCPCATFPCAAAPIAPSLRCLHLGLQLRQRCRAKVEADVLDLERRRAAMKLLPCNTSGSDARNDPAPGGRGGDTDRGSDGSWVDVASPRRTQSMESMGSLDSIESS